MKKDYKKRLVKGIKIFLKKKKKKATIRAWKIWKYISEDEKQKLVEYKVSKNKNVSQVKTDPWFSIFRTHLKWSASIRNLLFGKPFFSGNHKKLVFQVGQAIGSFKPM